MTDPTHSTRLDGKRIVVTGSSQGIGRAVALRVGREGGRVLVTGSGMGAGGRGATERALAAIVEEIETLGGEGASFVGSVAEDGVAREMIETAVARFGGLDGLVNCAGIPEPPGSSILDIEPGDWERVRSVHLEGTFHSCRHALPHLMTSGGGSLVNTSSHAHLGIYGGTAYGAAKGAINSLTWELAADLRDKNIRCNAICPGARTRISTGPDYEAQIERLESRGLLTREMAKASRQVPPPEGCASLYAYLLSDASAPISGEIFSATGGYVGVFARPTERMLMMKQGTSPWTLDDLAEKLPQEIDPS
jgi:NAD(P)-dependent dehydrogenase (short-subunit alcohol dehydrogenase family)